MAGCGGSGLVGTWDMYVPEEEAAMLAMLGFDMSMSKEFNRNGNVTITIDMFGTSERETGTWSTSGNNLTLSVDGDTEVFGYLISGDRLTLEIDDEILEFVRR